MTVSVFPRYVWPRDESRQREVVAWEFAHSPLEADGIVPSPAAADRAIWRPVQAPGSMIQWECHLAGIGEPGSSAPGHPYVGTNSLDYRWTSGVTWWFRATISHQELDPQSRRAELVFDGLDHDSWVWLDGALVADHQGMFGGPVLDLSERLSDAEGSEHEVVVALRPAGAGQGKEIGWGTKGRLVKPETFCRWVNNPDLMTCGIWQPVRLVQTGEHRLERPRITTELAADGSAEVSVEVEVVRADVQADLHWVQRHGGVPPVWDRRFLREGDDPTGGRSTSSTPSPATVSASLRDPSGAVVASAQSIVDVSPGRVWARLDLKVADPQLWWPAGLAPDGATPALYTAGIDLAGPAEDHLDVRIGLREIDWQRADGPRLADHWFDWRARINGVVSPLRGMNWMPSDVLRQDAQRIRHLLTLMRDAGVQIVRVWGGGLIETEHFYDACDELGLLVWQDFPINTLYDCSDIPLGVWEQQVAWSIERLRNRASLAVWCGGNEFDPYAPENAAVVGILERTLTDLDGTRPFVRSCSDPGDVHPYLDCDTTWYLDLYRDAPAISEWGGHTLPTVASLAEVLPADELERPLGELLDVDPEAFPAGHPALHHHWSEFQPDRVPRMLSRARIYDDLSTASFAQAVEAIQLGAAEIYQTIITDFSAGDTAAQMLMPWTYNRAWPSVGMQLVDHSGRPTAGYYAVKRGYRPGAILIRPDAEALAPGEPLRFAVGLTDPADDPEAAARTVRVTVHDQSLQVLLDETIAVTAGADNVHDLTVAQPSGDPEGMRAAIIVATDADDPEVQHVRIIRVAPSLSDAEARAAYRAAPQPTAHYANGASLRRGIAAKPADVRWAATPDDGEIVVTIENTGAVAAAFVTITSTDPLWMLLPDDNGFWIVAGDTRSVRVRARPTAEVSTIVGVGPASETRPADVVSVSGWNL